MTTQKAPVASVSRPLTRQRGVSLIEVLGALMIGAVLIFGLMGMIDRSLDDSKGQQAASYHAQLTNAARRYIEANAAVLSANPGGADIQTVSVQDLKDAKFLSLSFALTNVYRHGACVLIRRPYPVDFPNRLDALVVATGGDKIGDKDLAAVALQAGPGSGFIESRAPTIARGASWQIDPTTAYQRHGCASGVELNGSDDDGGHLVSSLFYDGAGQLAADFLYRGKVDGKPELNTMSTPLLLSGEALVDAGSNCRNPLGVAAPALAVDADTQALVSCGADGFWSASSSWKAPVENYDALVALTDHKSGDVRMVMDAVKGYSRAFTFNGANWVALAVDQDGDLKVTRDVQTASLHASGHIVTLQDLHVGQTAYLEADTVITGRTSMGGDVTVGMPVSEGTNANVTVNGNMTANGVEAKVWMATPAVSVSDMKVHNGVCNYFVPDNPYRQYPTGTIVMDVNQRPLICGPGDLFWYADGS